MSTRPPRPSNEAVRHADAELAAVHLANERRLTRLRDGTTALRTETDQLLAEVDAVLGSTPPAHAVVAVTREGVDGPAHLGHRLGVSSQLASTLPWAQTVSEARNELHREGVDTRSLQSRDLLTLDEFAALNEYLARPIYERIPWDRWDFMFAFGAGLVGACIDVFLGTPGQFVQRAMADKSHWLGSAMERIHSTAPGRAPIDYQGPKFGGGFHRGLTTGHDLFRPLEGISQFKDGVFRGFYWQDGIKQIVKTELNQYGASYESMSWASAVVAWLIHNFCDFFSSTSLPIPGTSWLYSSSSREIRAFIQRDVYQHGINLRHVTLQTVAPVSVEIILRSYAAMRYRNCGAPDAAVRQKRTELLALGHSVTMAANLGKLAVSQDPTLLNVPQLVATMKHLLALVLLEQGRHSFIAKLRRNVADMAVSQDALERLLARRLPEPLTLQ